MKRLVRSILTLAVLALTPAIASAQGYIATDRFGYHGTVTKYTTLADLLAHANGTSIASPNRDLGLYFIDNNAAFAGGYPPTAAYFLSAWYLNGGNTPSNGNTGFIQMADGDGGTLTSQSQYWTNTARTDFAFNAKGGNSIYGCGGDPQDCGRLWNGATASGGIFHSYMLSLIATGLAPATFNATTNVWESVSQPTGVTGTMSGVFENNSPTDVANNGFYEYSMAIDMNSYANDNGYLANDPSYFGADTTVTPEPATFGLLATGLIGVIGVGRRRRKNGK